MFVSWKEGKKEKKIEKIKEREKKKERERNRKRERGKEKWVKYINEFGAHVIVEDN